MNAQEKKPIWMVAGTLLWLLQPGSAASLPGTCVAGELLQTPYLSEFCFVFCMSQSAAVSLAPWV